MTPETLEKKLNEEYKDVGTITVKSFEECDVPIKDIMKKHKHDWDLGDDSCWRCGAYSEYCRVEGCHAIRECTADGECEVIDE